jgi:hypothetical protein
MGAMPNSRSWLKLADTGLAASGRDMRGSTHTHTHTHNGDELLWHTI